MRTGVFEREFTERKDVWVPRGFSERSKSYVYPNTGWSWTDWGSEIQDTWETLDAAVKGISRGYLKDMIETQQIVDIVFINTITERKVAESRTVTAYTRNGAALAAPTMVASKGLGLITDDDYVLFRRAGETTAGGFYGRVRAVQGDEAYIRIINGAWTMTVREVDGKLYMIPHKDDHDQTPAELVIYHIGVPDPNHSRSDYQHQMAFYADTLKEAS